MDTRTDPALLEHPTATPRETIPAYWATIGRIIIGLFFLSSGVGKLMGEPGAIQEMMRQGFPLVVPLYWATAVFETVMGAALVLGILIGWTAVLLALFTLATALTIHTFWNNPPGSMAQMSNLINFEKNFAIIGGLLALGSLGPGPLAMRIPSRDQNRS
jgi:putative oxidoreductase